MHGFFDATHSEFDGEDDWLADEAAGIDTRIRMEYDKVYRKLDPSYCSSCGPTASSATTLCTSCAETP